jgi:hypothetical protein
VLINKADAPPQQDQPQQPQSSTTTSTTTSSSSNSSPLDKYLKKEPQKQPEKGVETSLNFLRKFANNFYVGFLFFQKKSGKSDEENQPAQSPVKAAPSGINIIMVHTRNPFYPETDT